MWNFALCSPRARPVCQTDRDHMTETRPRRSQMDLSLSWRGRAGGGWGRGGWLLTVNLLIPPFMWAVYHPMGANLRQLIVHRHIIIIKGCPNLPVSINNQRRARRPILCPVLLPRPSCRRQTLRPWRPAPTRVRPVPPPPARIRPWRPAPIRPWGRERPAPVALRLG